MITDNDFHFTKLGGLELDVRRLHPSNDADLIEVFYRNSEPYSFFGTPSWGNYATEYFRDSIGNVEYHTYGFFVGKELIALWSCLTLAGKDNSIVSSQNNPIWPPVFTKIAPKKYRRLVIQSVLNFAQLNSGRWYSTEVLDTTQDLSEWQRQSLLLGAIPNIRYDLLVDLTMTAEEVWSKIRKSYKPLINKANETWGSEIITRPSESGWKEFSNLHEIVSGRQTRTLRTWEIQRQWIWKDTAFAVFLRDGHDKLIGAGLFTHNQHQANYFTGVYDRTLFDQPVGHLVQWKAILELQRRGVTTYRIGERSYAGLSQAPSDKDLTISFFKEGFATKTVPVSLLIHTTESLSKKSHDDAQE